MRVGFRTSSLADYHEAVGEHKQRAQRLMAFASRSQKNGCLHSTSKSFQHTIPTSPTKPATAKIRSMLIQLGLTMAAQQNQQVRQQQQQRQQRQTWSHPARHPQRQRQQLWSPAPGQQQRVLPRTGFESFAQTTTASFQTPQRTVGIVTMDSGTKSAFWHQPNLHSSHRTQQPHCINTPPALQSEPYSRSNNATPHFSPDDLKNLKHIITAGNLRPNVPASLKDARYYEIRRRNNIAAKKARQKRKRLAAAEALLDIAKE